MSKELPRWIVSRIKGIEPSTLRPFPQRRGECDLEGVEGNSFDCSIVNVWSMTPPLQVVREMSLFPINDAWEAWDSNQVFGDKRDVDQTLWPLGLL